jgi:heme oxygenase
LTSADGYRRILEASAAALPPLETALQRTGVSRLPQRKRAMAIATDLDQIGGITRPMPLIAPLNRNGMLGTMYVLEGSQFGAKICCARRLLQDA